MSPMDLVTPRRYRVILVGSCTLALVALGLIVWSLLDPRPVPVIASMSVAQALGTVSFFAYLAVVAADLRRLNRARTSIPPT